MVKWLARRIADLSLFWKVGFIIGVCLLVNTFLAFYFHHQFERLRSYLEKHPFFTYQALALEGLLLVEKARALSPADPQRAVLEERLKALAREGLGRKDDALEGPLGSLGLQGPPTDPLLQGALKGLLRASSLEESQKNLEKILAWSLRERRVLQAELERLARRRTFLDLLLGFLLFGFLLWGAFAFYAMVRRPLEDMRRCLERLILEGETTYLEDPEKRHLLRYSARDEIGRLGEVVERLLEHYSELALFRHTIEEDESVEEVYQRLGKVLRERLGLGAFILYQVSNSQDTMQVMFRSDPELECNAEKLLRADLCRAKRTGHVVSSLQQPEICRLFLWKEEAEHYCIPFMSGGRCVGVAQIILPKTESTWESLKFRERLRVAERFIQEAVPVIEAKRYAESLREQTIKDPLTGLYNRRFLEEALDSLVAGILRRGTALGILMCDLDYFKYVNDHYGHDVGDRVLRETAQLLAKNVRASDLVIRFGGEEFLVLLVDVKEGESVKVAEKLRAAVETHRFETPQGTLKRTISIGVSEFPTDAQAIWEAIKYADVALYRAKEMGRNRVVRFTPDMWPSEEY